MKKSGKRAVKVTRHVKHATVRHRTDHLDVQFPDVDPHIDSYYVYLTVNGEKVPYEVNPEEFALAIKAPGEYEVFTSDYGIASNVGLGKTKVEHDSNLIRMHIVKFDEIERTLTFSKADAHVVNRLIQSYMTTNKVPEQLKDNRIRTLIEEKLILLSELRHQIKLTKEWKTAFILSTLLLFALLVRMLFI